MVFFGSTTLLPWAIISGREREMQQAQRLAAEKAQHQGFPKLPPSRRLDGNLCYYCAMVFWMRMDDI